MNFFHYTANSPGGNKRCNGRRLEDSLKKAGQEMEFYVYPQAYHWFMENDRPDTSRPSYARLAWHKLVNFSHKKLLRWCKS
ncbi:MAG: dienelactone hydrolase family protein [Anaerolineaceae bacterium]